MAVTKQQTLDYHFGQRPGKIEVTPSKPCRTQRDLSLAYTPGVAIPCLEIEKNPHDAFKYTSRGNLVAVVSNGTAVLGLGDIGALAGKPVMNAIALNSSMFNGARIVGPAIAGILVAKIGEGWCFFANGLSYIAVITGLMLMQIQCVRRPKSGSPVADIIEGFRFVIHAKPIRALLLLLGLVSLVAMPYTVLMPVFADRILHGGARGLGLLMGATGVGALAGALTLAFRQGVRGLGRLVAWMCGMFGVSLFLFAMSRNFWLSVVLLIPVGFAMMLEMASSNTLIQAMVPDALRGRVMALYSMWEQEERPELKQLLPALVSKNVPLAAICGATLEIARTGLTRGVRHTSNGLDYLKSMVPSYKDESTYVDQLAVTDNNLITASGLGNVEFAREILRRLGVYEEADLAAWFDMFKRGVIPAAHQS